MESRAVSMHLATALDLLVQASEASRNDPTDRQAARRAIEHASIVAELARQEGFGVRETNSVTPPSPS